MKLNFLKPLINIMPEVESPKAKPVLKKRLMWVLFALLVFFILGTVNPVGVGVTAQTDWLKNLQIITASKLGTLATLGVGPIVMASIILQLLVGANVIQFDRNDPEDKRVFQGAQKLFAIAFCVFEAAIYVSSGFIPAAPGAFNYLILIVQLAFGGILVIYLDEVVSKYGIGSGVGIFIAAGVSESIIWGAFSLETSVATGEFTGLVPLLFQGIIAGDIESRAIFGLLFTVLIFLIVVYAESMKIEIPLTFGRVRGYGAKYPIKFLYVSNIPVILAAALFANIQLWGLALEGIGVPILGTFDPISRQPISGIASFVKAPYGALATPEQTWLSLSSPDIILNIIIFTIVMVIFCVIFGKFWVELSGMGSKQVSEQLQQVGLFIPGFRRDPRVAEHILDRYIPMITILGSVAVGLLAVFADLTGALGTGTGILLTVGIVYRIYEELAAESAFEMMPGLRGVIGG